MSLEADIRARVLGAAPVAAMVGERVFWKVRPQDSELPAIVLSLVFGGRAQSFDGAMGTQGHRVQFDCMAKRQTEAIALRDLLVPHIEGAGAAGDTEFQGGFVNLIRGDFADTADGLVHTEQVDATLWCS